MTDGAQETRKNIVLCSDGTGQTGATVGGTNVWKIRQAVDRQDHLQDASLRRQITFYDAGVGTSALSVKKMLGGAFGYGLSANMRQLYANLCKTYRDGDRIYILGFSRGAFTARSLAGMISEVGVIDGRRDNEVLEQLVKQAYKVPGLEGPAARYWALLGRGVEALSPGLTKHVTRAVFKIPGPVVLILVIAVVLIRRKGRRVAELKHMGLDLWRGCFEHSR